MVQQLSTMPAWMYVGGYDKPLPTYPWNTTDPFDAYGAGHAYVDKTCGQVARYGKSQIIKLLLFFFSKSRQKSRLKICFAPSTFETRSRIQNKKSQPLLMMLGFSQVLWAPSWLVHKRRL